MCSRSTLHAFKCVVSSQYGVGNFENNNFRGAVNSVIVSK